MIGKVLNIRFTANMRVHAFNNFPLTKSKVNFAISTTIKEVDNILDEKEQ